MAAWPARRAPGTVDRVPPEAPYYVYLARCADGSIYTGIAADVAARIAAHDRGKGARYTRGRGPLAVHAVRRCASKGDALRLERAVKRLPRAAKEGLADARRFRALARAVASVPQPSRNTRSGTLRVPCASESATRASTATPRRRA